MSPQIAPYVLEAAGEAFRIVVKEWAARRANTVEAQAVRVLPPLPPPEPDGCPYCNVATQLAASHLYLWRAAERPELHGIYVELAKTRVDDAMDVARDLPGDLSRGDLGAKVRDLDAALVTCADADTCRTIARQMWVVSMVALRYAESQHKDGQPKLPGSEAKRGP